MDAALSSAVVESVSADGPTTTDQQVRLSLEEMEQVLRHWEGLDAVKWDDETRMACSELIEVHPLTVEQWKERLVDVRKIPLDVHERYRKVMKLLLDKKRIDQFAYDAELEAMEKFSPALLARRGKEFADWYRKTD